MKKENIIVSEQQQQSLSSRLLNKVKSLLYCECFQSLISKQYNQKPIMIPKQTSENNGKKTLVIDLDETLVHSSFNYISDPDFILKIKVMNINYTIYVRIRPGAEEFLQKMSEFYEIFIFTASISEYADPVIDKIDTQKLCAVRLYRPNCSILNGVFVKDLAKLQRQINNIIIIDNTQSSFSLQPRNAIHIKNYFDDPSDTELYDLMPFLILLSNFDDVRPIESFWKQYIRYEIIKYQKNGESYCYDRSKNESFDETEAINQTMDISKDNSSLLKKPQLKLQTKFEFQDENYESEEDTQYRNEQNINSPNVQVLQNPEFNELNETERNI